MVLSKFQLFQHKKSLKWSRNCDFVVTLCFLQLSRKCQFKLMIKMSISWQKFSCRQSLWTWCLFQFLKCHLLTKSLSSAIFRLTRISRRISLSCRWSIFGLPGPAKDLHSFCKKKIPNSAYLERHKKKKKFI